MKLFVPGWALHPATNTLTPDTLQQVAEFDYMSSTWKIDGKPTPCSKDFFNPDHLLLCSIQIARQLYSYVLFQLILMHNRVPWVVVSFLLVPNVKKTVLHNSNESDVQ